MKKIITLCFGLAAIFTVKAQGIQLDRSVTASSGNYASGTGISIAFTVGQGSAVSTATGTNIIATQGFQQPDASPTAINELNISSADISVYPNPAKESFAVDIKYKNNYGLKLTLYNVIGQAVRTQVSKASAGTQKEIVNITGLSQGMYLLEIAMEDNGKIFKFTRKVNIIN